jgi:Phage integrase, N-terminal SAM-like domain/Phage integrase family
MHIHEAIRLLREACALKHTALKTEKSYSHWLIRYAAFLKSPQARPHSAAEQKIESFLTTLALKGVSASTQNQAFNALLFFYRYALKQELGDINSLRAKRPAALRHCPTREETLKLLSHAADVHGYPTRLIVHLLYACGLRVSEPLNLRIKDLDLKNRRLHIHQSKGNKGRIVNFPDCLSAHLERQLVLAKAVAAQDLAKRIPVALPGLLAKKYNVPASDSVPALLQVVQTELADRGIASLALMDINTAIYPATTPPNSLDELDLSVPFVGGFFLWEEGYSTNFVNRAVSFNTNGSWTRPAPSAQTAILVSEKDVMNQSRGFSSGLFMLQNGVPCDIIYRPEDMARYQNVYVLPDQPAFGADAAAQQALQSFVAGGGNLPASLYQPFPTPYTVFDFEQSAFLNAFWIAGNGLGTLLVAKDSAQARHGSGALRWYYSLPASPAGNTPMFDLAIRDWNLTGLQKVGLWCYLDCSGPKTGNVMTMSLIRYHAGLPATSLGTWNAGTQSVPSGQWVWHEWTVPTNQDMTGVDYLRLQYNAGDGWQPIARNGTNVTIYLDDIAFFFDHTNGSLTLTASGNSKGAGTVLSWPASASLFSLQSTTNLRTATTWTVVTNTPGWTNRQISVSVPIEGGQRFFRLSYP